MLQIHFMNPLNTKYFAYIYLQSSSVVNNILNSCFTSFNNNLYFIKTSKILNQTYLSLSISNQTISIRSVTLDTDFDTFGLAPVHLNAVGNINVTLEYTYESQVDAATHLYSGKFLKTVMIVQPKPHYNDNTYKKIDKPLKIS